MRRLSFAAWLAGIGLGLLALGARLSDAKDVGKPADAWDSKAGAPAWVEAPPSADGVIRWVFAKQSNLVSIAERFDPAIALREMRRSIAWRLRPLLAEGADVAFDVALPPPTVVKRAYHECLLGPPGVLGSNLATVWWLAEVPAGPVLEAIPADRRDDARRLLSLAQPADAPAWIDATTAKGVAAWEAIPRESSRDAARFELKFEGDTAAVARAQAVALGLDWLAYDVFRRIRPALAESEASSISERATTWARVRARAVGNPPKSIAAYEAWEIPVARVVDAAPAAKRDAVRAILEAKPTGK